MTPWCFMVGSRCSTSRVRQFKNGIKLYGAKSEVWTTSRESLMLCLSFKRWAKKHGSIIALSIRCVLGPNISLTIMIRRLESALMLWLERCRRRRGTELANTHGAFIRTIKKNNQGGCTYRSEMDNWSGRVSLLLSWIPSERDVWERKKSTSPPHLWGWTT